MYLQQKMKNIKSEYFYSNYVEIVIMLFGTK